MKNIKTIIISLLMTISTAFVVCINRALEFDSFKDVVFAFNENFILSSIVLIVSFYIYYKNNSVKKDKKIVKASVILSFLFSFSELAGFYLIKMNSFFNYSINFCTMIYNILVFCGYFSIFYTLLSIIIKKLLTIRIKKTRKQELTFFTNNGKSIFIVALLLIVFWISYYIIFFPGVVTNDSYYQIVQGIGYMPITNEHPFLHTIFEGLIVRLGTLLFGNVNNGIGFFTFIQMCVFAFIISSAIKYLAYKKVNIWIRMIILIFFALHPVIALYSITLWKDVWMAMFNLTYIIILYEMCSNREVFFKQKFGLTLLFINILLILFSKGTGIIIIVISFIPIIFVLKQYLKKIIIVFVSAIFVFFLTNTISQKVFNITPGHVREPLSIPIQQISRTVKYHYDELSQEEIDTLNEIFPVDRLGELYSPVLSDNTKGVLNENNFKKNTFKYVKIWLNLGFKHPFTYADSFLSNSFGYWYPETIYWTVFNIDYINRLNYFKEVWPNEKYDENYANYTINEKREKIKDFIVDVINKAVRKVPVLSCVFSIGLYFWIDLICMVIIIIKKQYNILPIHFTILATFIICISSPVYAEFRYAYPALVTLPFVILFSLSANRRKKES